jgi:hypothetical protein
MHRLSNESFSLTITNAKFNDAMGDFLLVDSRLATLTDSRIRATSPSFDISCSDDAFGNARCIA